MDRDQTRHDELKRLEPEYYRGLAYVHWSMTIDQRKQGWLGDAFHSQFREILTHTMFRNALACPIYCCMPDHLHLLWMGLLDGSDQLNAVKYFRKQLNRVLGRFNATLQKQPFDHVLRDDERQEMAFQNVVEYIARNPERAELIAVDQFREYPYTGCLVPGFPELTLGQPDFWERFWRTYSYLRREGLMRLRSS